MLTKCWDMDTVTRATFSQLKSILEGLLLTNEESPPVDLDYELQQQARGGLQHMGGPACCGGQSLVTPRMVHVY